MNVRVRRVVVAILPVAMLMACEQAKSSSPMSPNVAGPMNGISLPAPVPLTPVHGSQIQDKDQPITLVMGNPDTNTPRPVALRAQLAADGDFNSIVFSIDGLTPGADNRTSYRLSDRLQSGRTYFLRVGASDGANDSGWSSPIRFDVLNPIVLGTPEPVSPTGNERVSTVTPEFVVSNGNSSGPVGSLLVNFEIADNPALANPFTVAVVPQGGGETRYTMPPVPAWDRTFYWRARNFDNSNTGNWSRIETFRAPVTPPPPAPLPIPGGGGGGGGPVGGNWENCGSTPGEDIVRCVHAAVQPGASMARAFEVTKRVAWLLRGQSYGLLSKPGGENIITWQGKTVAVARVCLPNGHIFKIMTDVGDGGTNGPTWHFEDIVETNRYIPAMNPNLPEPVAFLYPGASSKTPNLDLWLNYALRPKQTVLGLR